MHPKWLFYPYHFGAWTFWTSAITLIITLFVVGQLDTAPTHFYRTITPPIVFFLLTAAIVGGVCWVLVFVCVAKTTIQEVYSWRKITRRPASEFPANPKDRTRLQDWAVRKILQPLARKADDASSWRDKARNSLRVADEEESRKLAAQAESPKDLIIQNKKDSKAIAHHKSVIKLCKQIFQNREKRADRWHKKFRTANNFFRAIGVFTTKEENEIAKRLITNKEVIIPT